METYFKNFENGYIVSVSTGNGMTEVSKEAYEEILSVIHSAPEAEDGFRYRLKTDLTWELVELPPEDNDPELSDAEALNIILGGEV